MDVPEPVLPHPSVEFQLCTYQTDKGLRGGVWRYANPSPHGGAQLTENTARRLRTPHSTTRPDEELVNTCIEVLALYRMLGIDPNYHYRCQAEQSHT